MSAAGRAAWELAFVKSPIFLTRGIAASLPGTSGGGILPIVALTDPAAFLTGGLSDATKFFADWNVLPGGTLANQKVATYTFANQAVAANAVIADGLNVSMMMICPARAGSAVSAVVGALAGGFEGAALGTGAAPGLVAGALAGLGGYTGKLATMTALQKAIAQHNALGGTYSVVTPSYIYTDCLMLTIQDVSAEGETGQKQVRWQWNFYQPLVLTQAAAASALNSLMQKLQSQLPLSGPSQVLGASGLAAGGNVSPLTAIFPPGTASAAQASSLLVPQ